MENNSIQWFLLKRNCPDILAVFNYRKELLTTNFLDEWQITHLMSHPNEQAKQEFFLVPSRSRQLPVTCKKSGILTLQEFIDLDVIPRACKPRKRIDEATKARVIELRKNGVSIRQVAAMCDVAKSTVEKTLHSA